MTVRALQVFFSMLLVVIVEAPQSAGATAGFAEWVVATPGGNFISHTDGLMEEYGDCITEGPTQTGKVLVAHLKRWRYYEGYIAGENKEGYFLLNEQSKSLRKLATEVELKTSIAGLYTPSLSDWLEGADGHAEAWFPYFTWRPCQLVLGKRTPKDAAELHAVNELKSRGELNEVVCRRWEDRYPLYRRTTWGKACREMSGKRAGAGTASGDAVLKEFCGDLLTDKSRHGGASAAR